MKKPLKDSLFGRRLGGRISRKAFAVDPQLIDCWASGGAKFKMAADGTYSIFVGPSPYSVSANGQVLTWEGMSLQRQSGSGTSVVGVWAGTDEGDRLEIQFNEDGTSLYRLVDLDETYTGTYAVIGNMLTIFEKRAIIATNGNQITTVTVFGDTFTGTYTVSETEWVVDYGANGKVRYLRKPC